MRRDVRPQRVDREQVALLALAAGVADHAGGPADQRDRPMPGLLKPPQDHQRHQVPDVQAVGRRIEAGVERAAAGAQPAGQLGVVGGLVDQAAPRQVGKDVFQGSPRSMLRTQIVGQAAVTMTKILADQALGGRRDAAYSPHVVVGERMAGAGQLGLGQGLQRLLGQPQVFAGGDLQVDRRAGHDRHRVADPLDQLRVVGGLKVASLGVGVEQQLAAKDLRRLGFPQAGRAGRSLRSCGPRRPA